MGGLLKQLQYGIVLAHKNMAQGSHCLPGFFKLRGLAGGQCLLVIPIYGGTNLLIRAQYQQLPTFPPCGFKRFGTGCGQRNRWMGLLIRFEC
jgi:hypothetical protein